MNTKIDIYKRRSSSCKLFIAAYLSAKESFTSTLTSEPAMQWRRHELAGTANVSAQS